MGYIEDLALLKEYGIEIADTKRFTLNTDPAKIEEKFEFPFVIKVEGKSELHKTDVGGVKIVENREDLQDFIKHVKDIQSEYQIKDLVAQEMVNGTELFIGAKRDAQFGPIILFGLGGIFVEIIGKPVIRLAPITKKDAETMIRETKGKEIIEGARGREPVNKNKLVKTLVAVSNMIVERGDIKEIDINPIIGNSKHVKAVDVRIIR